MRQGFFARGSKPSGSRKSLGPRQQRSCPLHRQSSYDALVMDMLIISAQISSLSLQRADQHAQGDSDEELMALDNGKHRDKKRLRLQDANAA